MSNRTERCSLPDKTERCIAGFCLLVLVCLTLTAGCTVWTKLYSSSIAPLKTPFAMPQLEAPSFPNRTFDIRNYGAVGDGRTLNTAAFADAIAAAKADA